MQVIGVFSIPTGEDLKKLVLGYQTSGHKAKQDIAQRSPVRALTSRTRHTDVG
jgi:hypothetical protein